MDTWLKKWWHDLRSRTGSEPTPPEAFVAENRDKDEPTAESQEEKEEYHKPGTISEAYNNPLYQNKIVIESPEGLFSTTSGSRAVNQFRKLQDKYPDQPPVLTVIPKGTMVSVPTQGLPAQNLSSDSSKQKKKD